MLEKNLRILQLNMMKSGPRMVALINDPQSLDLDVLLIQEPSITTYRTHINHSAWRLYRPTTLTPFDFAAYSMSIEEFLPHHIANYHATTQMSRPLRSGQPTPKRWYFRSTYLQYHFSRATTRQHYQPSRRYKTLSQAPHKMSSARRVLLFPVISTDTIQCGATTISLLDSLKTPAT